MQQINKNEKWIILLVSLITISAFLPMFTNGFVEWDDWYYVTHNELIRSLSLHNFWIWFTQPLKGLYQPLIQLSFALNYAIDGLNPTVFHTTNLLIHTVNSILVYYFIVRLSKNQFMAVLTALLFSIHPLHVESVAWATERKDTLYTFFFLLGLIYYQRFITNNSQKTYNLAFLMLALSLLSKGSAVAFPVVLVLIDFVEKRKWYSQKVLLEKAPFFILAFFYGVLTFWLHYRWGAARNHTGLPMSERVIMTAYSFYLYLEKIVLPIRLSTLYPIPYGLSAGIYWLSYLVYFVALAISYFKNRLIFFGLAFFLSIALFLMTVGVPIIIADRFTYIPSIGLFLVFTYALDSLFQKIKIKEMLKYLIVSPLLVIFVYLSFQQTKTWHDDFSLWDNAVRQGYEDCQIRTKRGAALIQLKRYDEAVHDLNRSIELDSAYILAFSYRGYVYSLTERYDEAKRDFLRVFKETPNDIFVQNSLGYIEYKYGNYEEALEYIEAVLTTDVVNFHANKNKGFVLLKQHKFEEACRYLQIASRHKPESNYENDIEELEKEINKYCLK